MRLEALEHLFSNVFDVGEAEVVGTWASVDLAAAIRKLASVALKARRQNELSLIRTRMIRSGKATQRFTSRTVKPYRAPREHYAFIADCIHR